MLIIVIVIILFFIMSMCYCYRENFNSMFSNSVLKKLNKNKFTQDDLKQIWYMKRKKEVTNITKKITDKEWERKMKFLKKSK